MPVLTHGTIPISHEERRALITLGRRHKLQSFTRRDPGNTGPLVAEAGGKRYLINKQGKIKRLGWWSRG